MALEQAFLMHAFITSSISTEVAMTLIFFKKIFFAYRTLIWCWYIVSGWSKFKNNIILIEQEFSNIALIDDKIHFVDIIFHRLSIDKSGYVSVSTRLYTSRQVIRFNLSIVISPLRMHRCPWHSNLFTVTNVRICHFWLFCFVIIDIHLYILKRIYICRF